MLHMKKQTRLRLKNHDEIEGANKCLKYVESLIHDCKNLDELKFLVLLTNTNIDSAREHVLKKEIEAELRHIHFYDNCSQAPCTTCENDECMRWYEVQRELKYKC